MLTSCCCMCWCWQLTRADGADEGVEVAITASKLLDQAALEQEVTGTIWYDISTHYGIDSRLSVFCLHAVLYAAWVTCTYINKRPALIDDVVCTDCRSRDGNWKWWKRCRGMYKLYIWLCITSTIFHLIQLWVHSWSTLNYVVVFVRCSMMLSYPAYTYPSTNIYISLPPVWLLHFSAYYYTLLRVMTR
jgi:hypothetical protein